MAAQRAYCRPTFDICRVPSTGNSSQRAASSSSSLSHYGGGGFGVANVDCTRICRSASFYPGRGVKSLLVRISERPQQQPVLSVQSPPSRKSFFSSSFRCNSATDDSNSSTSASPPSPPSPSSSPSSSQTKEENGEPERQVETQELAQELQQQLRQPRGGGSRRGADSTDWISSSLTRRFGLVGGLAWVGFLAFGVISEQIKTRTEVYRESQATKDVDDAKEVTMPNNVKYKDLREGGGQSPLKGDLVALDVVGRVKSTGAVFVDTTAGSNRSLAFVYGLKPYPRGICYGLEYALQSMKAGGKRRVTVPSENCFGDKGDDLGNGAVIPGGEDIEYDVDLQRVSISP